MQTSDLVSLDAIAAARRRLQDVAVVTPLDRSRALSDQCAGPVLVKCENLQRTGSFKIRGAYNRITQLGGDERVGGVIAASAGNHAQGVALAASLSGLRSTVFMPAGAALPKVAATRRYGAEVILTGKDFGAAYEAALAHADATGGVFVHPFDHPDVIAGQGVIGVEICEQTDEIGTVVVPIGGGGLVSGIAAAVKALRPGARVLGVQAAGAAAFPLSLAKGRPVAIERMSTIADGIAANEPGDLTFAHVEKLVDDIVTVTDEALAEAIVFALERMKLVLEPAGAAGVAAVLKGLGELRPPVVVVLSGGNIDPLLLLSVIRFGLGSVGRYFAFRTRVADRPGALHKLLGVIADAGANVIGVEHHRVGVAVHLGEVDVALQVETRGPDHIEELVEHLTQAGYDISTL